MPHFFFTQQATLELEIPFWITQAQSNKKIMDKPHVEIVRKFNSNLHGQEFIKASNLQIKAVLNYYSQDLISEIFSS